MYMWAIGRVRVHAPMQKTSETLISFMKNKFNIHMQQETLSSIQLKTAVLNGKSTSLQEIISSCVCAQYIRSVGRLAMAKRLLCLISRQ